MGGICRLHLGAGQYFWPGWCNLDEETDLKALPYETGKVDEIQSIHLFEHLPRAEIAAFLDEWFRVLKPNGRLVMEMPSLDKMAQLIVDGETNIRLTLLGIFGEQYGKPLMRHEWAWTNRELEEVLTTAGFEVEFEPPVFHIEARDLRVIGSKHGH